MDVSASTTARYRATEDECVSPRISRVLERKPAALARGKLQDFSDLRVGQLFGSIAAEENIVMAEQKRIDALQFKGATRAQGRS
jgi:hypothetical protein